MADIQIQDFARHLSFLDPEPPITKELDRWGSRYSSQKIHLYIWVSGQQFTGEGAYSREKGNSKVSTMYNRFLNPGGLLWLAEVLGEEESALRAAVAAAEEAEKHDYRKRCTAFREIIPWKRIEALYISFDQWLYDKRILPLLAIDYQTGYPEIKEGKRKRYLQIISEEESGKKKPPKQVSMGVDII